MRCFICGGTSAALCSCIKPYRAKHTYVCERCGKTKTCTISGCGGRGYVKICVKCLKVERK